MGGSTETSSTKVLVTVPEAARMLSIGRSTAYEMKLSGELPTIRIRSTTLVRVKDLEEMLDRLTTQAMEVA